MQAGLPDLAALVHFKHTCAPCINCPVQCSVVGHNCVLGINNGMGAGAGKFGLFLADITPEEWANHMNLNVNSVLFLTQLATPLLQASAHFLILSVGSHNVGQLSGRMQRKLMSFNFYACDKHGVQDQMHGNPGVCVVLQVDQLDVSAQASHGSIVNISSIAGQRPGRGAAAYSVSKAAVDMLTKASALELGPKVMRKHLRLL